MKTRRPFNFQKWIEENKPSGIVFTILCDRGERYCSILDS